MKQFHLKIATPDGPVFDGMADALLVKTNVGDVEFMSGHMDYFASLGVGRAKLTVGGVSRYASIQGGFVSIKDGDANLVTTTFEFADEIDLARAKQAKERAEETLNSTQDKRTIDIARAKLLRAINRINVAELK